MLTHASAVTFPFLSSLSEPVFTSLKSFPTSGPPFLSHMVFHFSRFVFLIFFFFLFSPSSLQPCPSILIAHNSLGTSFPITSPQILCHSSFPLSHFRVAPCSLFSPFLSFLISSLLDACVLPCVRVSGRVWIWMMNSSESKEALHFKIWSPLSVLPVVPISNFSFLFRPFHLFSCTVADCVKKEPAYLVFSLPYL